MKIEVGSVFTGKWFTGKVEVFDIQGNDLHVHLEKGNSKWCEVWNLEHTKAGFERGDYFSMSEEEIKKG